MAEKRKSKTPPKRKKATDEGLIRFKLDGEVIEITIGSLTFGEIEYIESYFDRSLSEIDLMAGRGIMLLAFTALKRKDPDFELDDLRSKQVNSLEYLDDEEAGDDADPPREGSTES